MTYQQWISRPVYRVQVFTYLVGCAVAVPANIRVVRAYRSAPIQTNRNQVASVVKALRQANLTRGEVRNVAQRMIDAPESYGGEVRSKIRKQLQSEVLTKLAI